MTLEIRLRRFPFLPDWIQTGNGGPRKAHYLGKRQATPVDKPDQGQRDEKPPQQPKQGKYRPLSSLTLGEVDAAMRDHLPQLVPSPTVGWIARNYFCQLPLTPRDDDRPPVVFGRVSSCFPGDGNIQNIEQLELQFPNRAAAPDLLNIRRGDLLPQGLMQSYCVGVRMFLSEDELQDFSRSENIFVEKGFAPLYASGYLDLLDVSEHNQSSHIWLNVIGSEWFAAIPDSVQPEIRERLREMVGWGKVLLNYHPKRYALRYLSLNEELDFSYGFTRHFLLAPQDTGQVLHKVEQIFEESFLHGMF